MASYDFLQNYWWFIISLLAGLLVFLMFVQGGQSLIFSLGKDPKYRRMLVNSTGRKWDLTFTTLVTLVAPSSPPSPSSTPPPSPVRTGYGC